MDGYSEKINRHKNRDHHVHRGTATWDYGRDPLPLKNPTPVGVGKGQLTL